MKQTDPHLSLVVALDLSGERPGRRSLCDAGRTGREGAALWGEVVLGKGGEIITQNFDRYPLMRMQSLPQIDIHLIESTEDQAGVGEVAVPTTAPALANAIAALTGSRVRRLPLAKTVRI